MYIAPKECRLHNFFSGTGYLESVLKLAPGANATSVQHILKIA